MIRRAGAVGSAQSQRATYEPIRKFREKNILSAVLGTATIVVLCASLVEPVWFTLEGGKCCLKYIGVNEFFGKIGSSSFLELPNDIQCKPETEAGNSAVVSWLLKVKSVWFRLDLNYKSRCCCQDYCICPVFEHLV